MKSWAPTARAAASTSACAADVIYMGPHATMGHTDAIAHVDPGSLMAGPTITAHTRGEPVDLGAGLGLDVEVLESGLDGAKGDGFAPAAKPRAKGALRAVGGHAPRGSDGAGGRGEGAGGGEGGEDRGAEGVDFGEGHAQSPTW